LRNTNSELTAEDRLGGFHVLMRRRGGMAAGYIHLDAQRLLRYYMSVNVLTKPIHLKAAGIPLGGFHMRPHLRHGHGGGTGP
jgi:hypothetical protein